MESVAEPAPALASTTSVPAFLNAHGELVSLFGGEVALRVRLAQKRQNRNAGVATDDGNVDVVNVQALGFGDERVRVERCRAS